MSARAVVIAHVQQQHVAQMAYAKYHDMMSAFPADRADQPFRVGVLPGRARRRGTISNADRPNPADKDLAISSIAIPDQIARSLLPAASLSELIGDPLRGRLRGHSQP